MLALALGSVAAAAQAPASEPIAIERLAQLPTFTDPQLSPDGRRIAARLSHGDGARIGVWDLRLDGAVQVAVIDASALISFEWAGDDRLLFNIVGVALVEGYGLALPVRRVVSHDFITRRSQPLCPGRGVVDQAIFIDPAGRHALISSSTALERTPRVQRVDLATGECVEVQPSRSGIDAWFADSSGIVRMGADYNQQRMRVFYRAAAHAELRLIDNERLVSDESVIEMARFVGQTGRGVIITNASTGRFGVYNYDFEGNARGEALFEHPEVDVTSAIFASDGTVDGVRYEDDRPRVRWLNTDLQRVQQVIDRALPNKTNQVLNRSRDGNRMLILSSAADDPGTFYVFDRTNRRLELFARPHEGLEGAALAEVRTVSYRSRDGLAINGYLTLPPGRPARGLPLIIYPHGGPFARDSWSYSPEVQFLASRGYAVLQPNFRGSTGYGRQFVERGYGQWGTGMIDDIEDGVDWLVRDGIADAARVCIMGASYGGYAALWAPIRNPDRYRCAISMAGISDVRAMLRYDSRLMSASRYSRAWRQRVQGQERGDLAAISPLQQAARARVPVLIAHGEQDTNVPASQSRDLVQVLERRGAPVESVFYPKAGHGFSSSEDFSDYLRRVEAFLARHNPAGPAGPTSAPPAAAGRVPNSQLSR